MNFALSSVVNADPVARGGHFAARRLDLDGLGRFAAPVMGLDHYRMSGPTFAAHPHAGFSAVSYVLEDSAGGLRSRDSLQHDVVIEPGAIVWTQAGAGIVHDEFPAQMGREVHALQVSINLSRQNKNLPPRMFHACQHCNSGSQRCKR
jgi:redox-sensitive bicupin YhaK (pirin superfamily)